MLERRLSELQLAVSDLAVSKGRSIFFGNLECFEVFDLGRIAQLLRDSPSGLEPPDVPYILRKNSEVPNSGTRDRELALTLRLLSPRRRPVAATGELGLGQGPMGR
jgi:hypothetical protein